MIASWQYRTVRIHRLWRALSQRGLDLIARIVLLTGVGLVGSIALLRYHQGGSADAGAMLLVTCGYIALLAWAMRVLPLGTANANDYFRQLLAAAGDAGDAVKHLFVRCVQQQHASQRF